MKIVAVSDVHGETRFAEQISHIIADADLLLLAGDLTNFGRRNEASRVVDAFRNSASRILAVSGNCDYPEVEQYLSDEGINIDRTEIEVGGIHFVGVGGSLPCPGKTPNEHSDFTLRRHLQEAVATLDTTAPIALVSHQPPVNTVADLAASGNHVGSESVRSFIEKNQPTFCITGHIHEGRGLDRIGDTPVVNAGPFCKGGYAVLDVIDDNVKIQINTAASG